MPIRLEEITDELHLAKMEGVRSFRIIRVEGPERLIVRSELSPGAKEIGRRLREDTQRPSERF